MLLASVLLNMEFSVCCYHDYWQASEVGYQGPERTKNVLSLIIDSIEVFLQWTFELSLQVQVKGDRRNTPAKPTAVGNSAGLGEKTVLSAVEEAREWSPVTWSFSRARKEAKKGVLSGWLKAWKPTKKFAHYCEQVDIIIVTKGMGRKRACFPGVTRI